MFEGKLEYDYHAKINKPELNEKISIKKGKDFFLHYSVEFIQHFFNENGKFMYVMITGIRKS
jgi:hypothetical protein